MAAFILKKADDHLGFFQKFEGVFLEIGQPGADQFFHRQIDQQRFQGQHPDVQLVGQLHDFHFPKSVAVKMRKDFGQLMKGAEI